MRVFATYNIKGGVGKTSTAVNLAYLCAAVGPPHPALGPRPAGRRHVPVPGQAPGQGRWRGLVTGRRPFDDAVKATDFDHLDLLPADFSYRNMDLELDDAKKRTRRLDQLLSAAWPTTTTSPSSTAHRASRWCRRTSCAPPTSCSCR